MSTTIKSDNAAEKRRCIFVARYQRLEDGVWRRVGRQPQIETYTSDVAEKYRQPVVCYVTPNRVTIRMFDEQAVNLTNVVDLLGDYRQAQDRCDDCLRSEVPDGNLTDLNSCLPCW